jgi:hypothetical protein
VQDAGPAADLVVAHVAVALENAREAVEQPQRDLATARGVVLVEEERLVARAAAERP